MKNTKQQSMENAEYENYLSRKNTKYEKYQL